MHVWNIHGSTHIKQRSVYAGKVVTVSKIPYFATDKDTHTCMVINSIKRALKSVFTKFRYHYSIPLIVQLTLHTL